MRICQRSFSLISFRGQIKSSSTGPVGFIDMTNLCTFPIHVSSFNLNIFLRGVVLTVQQLRQCFRHHFRVLTSTESIIVRLHYLGLMIPRGFVVFMKSTFKFLEESRRIRCIILEVSRRILSMDIYRSYVNSAWLFEFFRSFYVLLSSQNN